MPVFPAEAIQISCNFDILPAVRDNLTDAALLPPSQGLKAVGAFAFSQGCSGQMGQGQAKSEIRFNRLENVQISQLLKVEIRVTPQHPIIEAIDIEADDQVEGLQALDQLFDLIFHIFAKPIFPRIVKYGTTDFHQVCTVPAADFSRRTLGFKVKNPKMQTFCRGGDCRGWGSQVRVRLNLNGGK